MANTRVIAIVTDDGKFELDVNPKELSVSQGSRDKTVDLLNIGEFNVQGNRGLVRVAVSTFLPDAGSHFNRSGTAPENIILSLKKSKNGKRPVQLIISGTDVNAKFTISSMGETYKEGQQDIYVDWSFVESRDLNTQPVASWVRRYTETGICSRGTSREVPKAITAVAGDSLWDIARRVFDDGSRWKEIAQANGMDRDRLDGGERLTIPG